MSFNRKCGKALRRSQRGKSGHGREKGFAALREFGTTKTIVVKHG